MFISIQKGSVSIIFSTTLLWLYPTILPSCGTSVSPHSPLRALGSSIILTFPFVSALLNPAPKVDGASLHQPLVTLQSKCFCFLSLREDGNIPKTSTKLSGYPPNHSFPAKHGEAQRRGSRCAKTIVHRDSHHSLLPSLLWLFVMFLWPWMGNTLTRNQPVWVFKTPKTLRLLTVTYRCNYIT